LVDVAELLALWHGDQDCVGYMCEEIVVAVTERVYPRSYDAVRLKFYPGLAESQIPEEELAMLKRGYDLWEKRGRHSRTAA